MAEVLHFTFNCLLSLSSASQHLPLSPGSRACLQPQASAVEQEPPGRPLRHGVPHTGAACEGGGSTQGPLSTWGTSPKWDCCVPGDRDLLGVPAAALPCWLLAAMGQGGNFRAAVGDPGMAERVFS